MTKKNNLLKQIDNLVTDKAVIQDRIDYDPETGEHILTMMNSITGMPMKIYGSQTALEGIISLKDED